MKRVITFGTFDLLHEGHIRILERARAMGDYLIVGISTDALNARKGKSAMFSQEQRKTYVEALEVVDEVFYEESLELKDEYIERYRADLLVMGDDWKGRFDWVSCDVTYLPRTPEVSSTDLKSNMLQTQQSRRILFGDTYVNKHYSCAISMVNEMLEANIAPVFTQTEELPRGLNVDCLAYFNRPSRVPPPEYDDVPRVCIDHGASNLKWFLASKDRFEFFDRIITAGPDHANSLMVFYPESDGHSKVRSAGFIKSADLLAPPNYSRAELCGLAGLDPRKEITLFVPTWYVSRNVDIQIAIDQLAGIKNHVAVLHPETVNLDVSKLNVMENIPGIVTELMKHADCIVSELSSTIFEAAPLNKPVVQILMREYSDNNAAAYDFPYVAGTADLFCGGVFCRPEKVADTVSDVYRHPARYKKFMAACQQRIRNGTVIAQDATEMITAELLLACKEGRPNRMDEGELERLRTTGLEKAHANLAYNRNQIIAHGGGNFQKHHASNSREAVSAAYQAVRMVEVDVVQGADGILLAHDGFEEKFGLDRPFNEVTRDEFSKAGFDGKLTTLNLDEFFELFEKGSGTVIFDVKNTNEEYASIISAIYDKTVTSGLMGRVVVQAYNKQDFELLSRLGFERSILAVWKYYYRSPLGEDAYEFITDCMQINDGLVFGISIPYYNYHMPKPSVEMDELMPFFAFWKRIFIHGAPQPEYPAILRRNMGLFADAFRQNLEFRQLPPKFSWRRYMFLNPGLVENGIDNQISATCHFIDWGESEGRPTDYELPPKFDVGRYIEKNQDLRVAGVSGPDSAKAHWTRHGAKQTREY